MARYLRLKASIALRKGNKNPPKELAGVSEKQTLFSSLCAKLTCVLAQVPYILLKTTSGINLLMWLFLEKLIFANTCQTMTLKMDELYGYLVSWLSKDAADLLRGCCCSIGSRWHCSDEYKHLFKVWQKRSCSCWTLSLCKKKKNGWENGFLNNGITTLENLTDFTFKLVYVYRYFPTSGFCWTKCFFLF